MNLLSGEHRPESCAQVGLDCRTCIQRTADSTAKICAGLSPGGVQQIFFQIYPSAGCRPMLDAFECVYAETADLLRNQIAAVAAA